MCGVLTKRKKNTDVVNSTLEASSSVSSVDVNYFHELLGHCGEKKTREIANYYNVKLSGKFNSCSDCAKGKQNKLTFQKVSQMRKEANYLGSVSF